MYCNVNLRGNTNRVFVIFNKKNFEPNITPIPSAKEGRGDWNSCQKFNLRIAVHNKPRRKKKELSEEEKEWIENFLETTDITYTTPERRDTVYVEMAGGKREYKQNRYLFWKLRDLLEIINGSRIFLHSQKLLNINSHFAKCTTSSKCISGLQQWHPTLFLFM